MHKHEQNMKQTLIQAMNMFKMFRIFKIVFFFLTIGTLNAQVTLPVLNLPPTYDKGVKTEFWSYPMFALSSYSLGLSNEFGRIDTDKSRRPLIFGVAGTVGMVSSAGMWGVGISLQGKPKPVDLLKIVGVGCLSYISYKAGTQSAMIFKRR
jgi:hypothetical protein